MPACPMCAAHVTPVRELSLAGLARALRGPGDAGVRVVEIPGGGPFLRRDRPQARKVASARWRGPRGGGVAR